MNTPAHAIINLLLVSRRTRENYPVAVMLGAFLPDIPIFLFYIQAKINQLPEKNIWRQHYFDVGWQALFDTFHSFPLLAVAGFVAWKYKARAVAVLFLSMFLHSLFDFPVHHNDAHRHFYPLTDFRFISPVSYWNPAYYGQIIGWAELAVVMVGGMWLWCTTRVSPLRRGVLVITALYLSFWGFVAAMWVF